MNGQCCTKSGSTTADSLLYCYISIIPMITIMIYSHEQLFSNILYCCLFRILQTVLYNTGAGDCFAILVAYRIIKILYLMTALRQNLSLNFSLSVNCSGRSKQPQNGIHNRWSTVGVKSVPTLVTIYAPLFNCIYSEPSKWLLACMKQSSWCSGCKSSYCSSKIAILLIDSLHCN